MNAVLQTGFKQNIFSRFFFYRIINIYAVFIIIIIIIMPVRFCYIFGTGLSSFNRASFNTYSQWACTPSNG